MFKEKIVNCVLGTIIFLQIGALAFITSSSVCVAAAEEKLVYEGTWVTTNRKLDGTMTAEVTDLGGNKWKGKFYGVWQGVRFSYDIEFSGPPNKLEGTARIDGANYRWTGEIGRDSPSWFKGKFDGDRYLGHFELKEKR